MTFDMLSPDLVVARYAAITRTPPDFLTGRDRTREISRRRDELLWLLRHITPASFNDIAIMFGRDASTVNEAVARVSDRIAEDAGCRTRIRDLRDQILQAHPVAGQTSPVTGDVAVIAALGVLTDAALSDADARIAAVTLLGGASHA